jgi:hypothetical protein
MSDKIPQLLRPAGCASRSPLPVSSSRIASRCCSARRIARTRSAGSSWSTQPRKSARSWHVRDRGRRSEEEPERTVELARDEVQLAERRMGRAGLELHDPFRLDAHGLHEVIPGHPAELSGPLQCANIDRCACHVGPSVRPRRAAAFRPALRPIVGTARPCSGRRARTARRTPRPRRLALVPRTDVQAAARGGLPLRVSISGPRAANWTDRFDGILMRIHRILPAPDDTECELGLGFRVPEKYPQPGEERCSGSRQDAAPEKVHQ